jgi:hypothetical protein
MHTSSPYRFGLPAIIRPLVGNSHLTPFATATIVYADSIIERCAAVLADFRGFAVVIGRVFASDDWAVVFVVALKAGNGFELSHIESSTTSISRLSSARLARISRTKLHAISNLT